MVNRCRCRCTVDKSVLVCELFLDDVYEVAGMLNVTKWFEVCEHAVFHVWTEHVLEQSREIFQLERVARYRKLQLTAHVVNY